MSTLEVKRTRKYDPLTPIRQKQILEQLSDFSRPVTLTTVARKARLDPKVFRDTVKKAALDAKDKHHRFALDVYEVWARREEQILSELWQKAKSSRDHKPYFDMLKKMYAEDWGEIPAAQQAPVTIGHVEKMALIQGAQVDNALPTGD